MGAGLALDVERAREVLLGALQLELGAAAALAVLAEAGVGQHLEHVDQPAAGTVEPVFALAVSRKASDDRDLGEVAVERAVRVVDHHLDLRRARALDAVTAGEDHVLHRLAADRERALLAQGPEHGVGDVRLAGPVRTHHDGDPRREFELGALREGLEALHGYGPEVHYSSSDSRACKAASCSAPFLVFPSPRPSSSPLTSATATKLRSCGGASSDSSLHAHTSAP